MNVAAPLLLLLATLNVTLPTEWSVQDAPLPVVVYGAAGTGPLHASGSFAEMSDRNALPADAIELCKAPAGACETDAAPSPGAAQTLYLRYRGGASPGIYAGQLIIHSNVDNSNAKSLTLYVSSPLHHGGGVTAVIVGGILAWWVKVYASNRVTRDQALLPVALYHERLSALAASLQKARSLTGAPTPNLSGAVADWVERLDVTSLEAQFNLPGKKPSAFVPTPSIPSNFTSFLTQVEAAVALLADFVRGGVERVLEAADDGRIPSPKVAPAVRAIDDLYRPQLKPEEAQSLIRNVLAKAEAPEGAADLLPAAQAETRPGPPSLSRLLIEIRRLNSTAWFVLLGVTAIGTITTLVLKPGFGRLSDYLFCLIAAFGIPMLGSIAMPSQTAAAALVTTSTQAVSGSKGTGTL